MPLVIIENTPEDLAVRAAGIVAAAIEGAAGPFTLGLAGGSTPEGTHRRLAAMGLDWSSVALWLGDERYVAHDDPESNTGMVRRTLAQPTGAVLEAPDTSLQDPTEAARRYAAALDRLWTVRDGGAAPDLVMLGIGDDGHTASLFPGTDAIEARHQDYVANWVPEKHAWRLTATIELLRSARTLLFLVVGEQKAEVVADIIDRGVPHPAGVVSDGSPNPIWLLDRAASSRLGSA